MINLQYRFNLIICSLIPFYVTLTQIFIYTYCKRPFKDRRSNILEIGLQISITITYITIILVDIIGYEKIYGNTIILAALQIPEL